MQDRPQRWAWLALVMAWPSAGCIRDFVYPRLAPPPLEAEPPPLGLTDVSAETCGACHTAIYAEWSGSMMAAAWTDPVFQTDFFEQGEVYACRSCHSPRQDQWPELVSGLKSLRPLRADSSPNPAFDPGLQAEGVTCVVCHLAAGAIHTANPVAADSLAPHALRSTPGFGATETCARCHQHPAPPFTGMKRPILDTVNEWTEWKAATGRTESCVDCHMPPVDRAWVVGQPVRTGHHHGFPGAWDTEMLTQHLSIQTVRQRDEDLEIVLRLDVGHRVPSAEPGRQLRLDVHRLGPTGASIGLESVRFERRVSIPAYKERGDSTLMGGTPTVVVPLPPGPASAALLRIELWFDRLAHLTHPEQGVQAGAAEVLIDHKEFHLSQQGSSD